MDGEDVAPIVLWCHPRSLSTAFERAFVERDDDFVCYHEPFGEPYYFGEEALSSRFIADTNGHSRKALTYMQVMQEQVLKEHTAISSIDGGEIKRKRVFVKDMAQYIVLPSGTAPHMQIEEGNPTVIPKRLLAKVRHSFLLRDPHKSIPSYWRMCVGDASQATGFHFYDPNEAGYLELRTLFEYVRTLTHETPLLLTAEDLLQDPVSTMHLYYHHMGVPFVPGMLHWEAKGIPSFDSWPGFHRMEL
ncbi:hypothetical protein GOP47_0016460 [Adiantum capillus-veneris]|uniref:Uncharacterized protein n=1 Tax=Adiantum capillus-veneris TaxID=13818 RepID=A0A9D4UHV6_ADICA|nr:hypothetical protein GOP47_0016460 [Adiantum capillus-veneris]